MRRGSQGARGAERVAVDLRSRSLPVWLPGLFTGLRFALIPVLLWLAEETRSAAAALRESRHCGRYLSGDVRCSVGYPDYARWLAARTGIDKWPPVYLQGLMVL